MSYVVSLLDSSDEDEYVREYRDWGRDSSDEDEYRGAGPDSISALFGNLREDIAGVTRRMIHEEAGVDRNVNRARTTAARDAETDEEDEEPAAKRARLERASTVITPATTPPKSSVTGGKKRPSPAFGAEAKRLDPALASGGDKRGKEVDEEERKEKDDDDDDDEPIVIADARKAVVDILTQSEHPPAYCAGGSRSLPFPGLAVAAPGGAGSLQRVQLPLLPPSPAPSRSGYLTGTAALAATGTRHPTAPLLQWGADEVRFDNRDTFMAQALALMGEVCAELKVDKDGVGLELYKVRARRRRLW